VRGIETWPRQVCQAGSLDHGSEIVEGAPAGGVGRGGWRMGLDTLSVGYLRQLDTDVCVRPSAGEGHEIATGSSAAQMKSIAPRRSRLEATHYLGEK
jgi:hypothetical protein